MVLVDLAGALEAAPPEFPGGRERLILFREEP
jgi:hypothetical protein